jgi:hypothetical protein
MYGYRRDIQLSRRNHRAVRRGVPAEKFQAFGQKLMPLIQQAGLKPDEPIIFPAHNFVNQ